MAQYIFCERGVARGFDAPGRFHGFFTLSRRFDSLSALRSLFHARLYHVSRVLVDSKYGSDFVRLESYNLL
jgi:hypothetical protein